jgi:hypothetical protein
MTTREHPNVGDWYQDLDGPKYEIVGVDEEEDLVEVQYIDGTVEELSLIEWADGFREGEIVKTDPPEGW